MHLTTAQRAAVFALGVLVCSTLSGSVSLALSRRRALTPVVRVGLGMNARSHTPVASPSGLIRAALSLAAAALAVVALSVVAAAAMLRAAPPIKPPRAVEDDVARIAPEDAVA